MAERETTVLLVDVEHLNIDSFTNLSELRWVLHLLSPREVRDVDETVNAFLHLNEYAEVSEVAHLGSVLAANRILLIDLLPWIFSQLLHAERHLALVAVESEDHCLNLVTHLHELLCRVEVCAPRHFRYVDETFYTRCNLDECAVVSHHNHLTLHLVTNLEVRIKSIPWVWSQLLQAKGDALLLVVEVDDHHVELLVELNDFLRIAYAAPREVCDMDETVNTTEVDEYAVVGDVLDSTFKNLSLFELRDDLLLLLLKLCLDKSLVADNHVAELLVDLHNLELHGLANECIVVADWLHVDLRTWEECLCAEHVNNHTTLCAALHVALYNLVVLQRCVHALPRTSLTSSLVRKHQLTLLVFLILDVNLNGVAHLEIGSITEFATSDDTLTLVADVHNNFAVVDSSHCTIYHLIVVHVVERAFIGCLLSRFVSCAHAVVLECFPIETFQRLNVLCFHK